MSRRGGFLNGVKENLGRAFKSDAFIHKLHGSCISQEKLPPRLNLRGISFAARVVSHEIRNFTKKTTGKDLVEIKDSKARNEAIKKITEFKLAVASQDVKFNFLTIASNHSTNFTKSLSPDGLESADIDYGFVKNNLIARYYRQCKLNEQMRVKKRNIPAFHTAKRDVVVNKYETPKKNLCGCYESVLDKRKNGCCFLSCWEHKGIKEEDLSRFYMENLSYINSGMLQQIEHNLNDRGGWKEFLKNDKCAVFRKKLPSGIYEYRVQASFPDVSANNLFRTQIDADYRKKWDNYLVNLDIVDSDKETSSELIHWVTKCPYPFSTREYIYLRRHKIDRENKAMILISEATNDTNIPEDPKVTRVDTYLSKLIIKPHTEDFDQNGCDFLLSYYDDPKMMLPSRIIDIASSRGIADSVVRMHEAALGLSSTSGEDDGC